MQTVSTTTTKTLSTPAEIVAHLREMTAVGADAGEFKVGDAVTIADRTGVPAIGNASDQGIVIASNPDNSFLTILVLMNGGFPIPLTVRPAALAPFKD